MRGKLQSILSIGTALLCLMALVGGQSVAQSADSKRQVAFAAVDTGGEPASWPTASAAVQTPQASSADEWEISIVPYFFLANMDGDVARRGFSKSIQVDTSTILDNLEAGAAVRLDVRKNRWAAHVDYQFMDVAVNPAIFETDFVATFGNRMSALEVAGGYRFGPPSQSFEFLSGVRYTRINSDIDIVSPVEANPGFEADWFDPFLGGRFGRDLSERVTFFARGDVGGFGAGSDFTWNVDTGFQIHLIRRIHLLLAYKAIDMDYQEGSASTDDFFAWDVLSQGGLFGIEFRF